MLNTFEGNLTEDPELRFTPGGLPVANFRMASNRQITNKDGSKTEKTIYFTVTVWREQAEYVASSLRKGNRVIVVGYLETEEWVDRDGNKRTTLRITANEVAASLRWATAQLTRAASSGTSSAPGAPTPPNPYDADQNHFGAPSGGDEPF
jgi:single-strand DNA-binding protein